jgi:hypothetical protein
LVLNGTVEIRDQAGKVPDAFQFGCQIASLQQSGIEASLLREVRTKRVRLRYACSVRVLLLRAGIKRIVQAIPKKVEADNNGDNG